MTTKFIAIMLFLLSAGTFSYNAYSQSGQWPLMCQGLENSLNSFENGFSGMYDPSSSYTNSYGTTTYYITTFPQGFIDGALNVSSINEILSVSYYLDYSPEMGSTDSVYSFIETCFTELGFKYQFFEEYFDDMEDAYYESSVYENDMFYGYIEIVQTEILFFAISFEMK